MGELNLLTHCHVTAIMDVGSVSEGVMLLSGCLFLEVDLKSTLDSLDSTGLEPSEAESSVRWMLEALEKEKAKDHDAKFLEWLERRERREPLQYILGSWPFHFLPAELLVRAPVLIPRPETEELVDRIITERKAAPPQQIVDFGSGSGALVLALLHAFPQAKGVAVDPSEAALALTSENAFRCGVDGRLSLFHGTAKEFGNSCDFGGPFDLIVSNPPYIPSREIPHIQPDVRDFEDHGALDGGQDGLDVVAEVLDTARKIGDQGAPIYLEVHHTHPSFFEEAERLVSCLQVWLVMMMVVR